MSQFKRSILTSLFMVNGFFTAVVVLALLCGNTCSSQVLSTAVSPSPYQVSLSPKFQDEKLGTRKKGVEWPGFLGAQRDSKSPEKGILKDWSGGKLKIKWTFPLTESYGIGSVDQGRFFQFDRVDGQEVLFCLNAETGKSIWKKSYDVDYRDLYGYNSGPRTSPLIEKDRVYTFGVSGELRCASDGSLRFIALSA